MNDWVGAYFVFWSVVQMTGLCWALGLLSDASEVPDPHYWPLLLMFVAVFDLPIVGRLLGWF